jgi:hypothetical protein
MLVTTFQIPAGQPIPDEEQDCFGPSAELVDFKPEPVSQNDLIGRRVDEITPNAGTYGMGGPGFFGIRFGEQWLIISIWGAGEWLHLGGRRLMDIHHEQQGSSVPWISSKGDELTPLLVGRVITSFSITKTTLELGFGDDVFLRIEEDSASRPIFQGTKQKRALQETDDLRRAVFLSPTPELWV